MTPLRLEPAALWSPVKHSTTEPLRSLRTLGLYGLKTKANNNKPYLELYLKCLVNHSTFQMTEGPKEMWPLEMQQGNSRHDTAKLKLLGHLWKHDNLFEIGVVRTTEN